MPPRVRDQHPALSGFGSGRSLGEECDLEAEMALGLARERYARPRIAEVVGALSQELEAHQDGAWARDVAQLLCEEASVVRRLIAYERPDEPESELALLGEIIAEISRKRRSGIRGWRGRWLA